MYGPPATSWISVVAPRAGYWSDEGVFRPGRTGARPAIGAPDRNRTCTTLRSADFKSAASTRSATGAPGRKCERPAHGRPFVLLHQPGGSAALGPVCRNVGRV